LELKAEETKWKETIDHRMSEEAYALSVAEEEGHKTEVASIVLGMLVLVLIAALAFTLSSKKQDIKAAVSDSMKELRPGDGSKCRSRAAGTRHRSLSWGRWKCRGLHKPMKWKI
jgi:hypothetical protein